MRKTLLAALVAASLIACSPPKVATCTQNTDCPADAICVSGKCQKGVPSGGGLGAVSGSARLTAGTKTMDVLIGQPIAPVGTDGGTRKMVPAENTR